MLAKKVWRPVDTSKFSYQEKNAIIISPMFLMEKRKPDRSINKLKARLVADGNMQDR